MPRCKSSLRLSEISVCERAMRGQPLQVTRAVICSVIGKPIQSALVITGKVITLEMGPGYQKAKNTIGPDLKSGRSLDPKISRSLAQDVVQCISRFSFSSDLST